MKLLRYSFFHILPGVTGVPRGSVTNEDTSPGPVQTYPRDFGGAPGRISVAAGGHHSPIYIHTYITLHYITYIHTLHTYITYIHYIHTLHTYITYIHSIHTLHTYIHYSTVQYSTLDYITLHYIHYIHTYIHACMHACIHTYLHTYNIYKYIYPPTPADASVSSSSAV